MTTFNAVARISGSASLKVVNRQTKYGVDGSDVRPTQLVSFRPNDFVLKQGFPALPSIWCRAQTLASAQGEYFSDDRQDAFVVEIPAHTRFIAADSTYDATAKIWTPTITNGVDYSFTGGASTSPVVDEVTYRIGKEVITNQALSFTPGTFLTSSFNNGSDDAIQFSVSMAVILETPGPYGIMAAPSAQNKLEITTDTNILNYTWSDRAGRSAELRPVTHLVPMFICLSVGPNYATLYTGTSPTSVHAFTVSSASVVTPMQFILGKTWSGSATAQFYLFEWALWDSTIGRTTDVSVFDIFGAYSSIYGAFSG